MKTFGLIGGMSWESSLEYYRIVNETVRDRLGPLHSARLVLYSVEFAEIEALQRAGDWTRLAELMIDAARRVERGGAGFLVLCTNTMHKVADAMEQAVRVPLLHIADATADAVKGRGLRRIGLLGTRFTMEEDFYRGRLAERHGLEVLVPTEAEREVVDRVIYDELCAGELRDESRAQYRRIMAHLVDHGAEGIILGCTEIGLLVGQGDSDVPLFDTTRIHAVAAAERALEA